MNPNDPKPSHCDDCDWTFTCWTGKDACRKKPITTQSPKPSQAAIDGTPRCDEAFNFQIACPQWQQRDIATRIARQLERELNFERKDNEELREANHALGPQLRDVLKELAAANRALDTERAELASWQKAHAVLREVLDTHETDRREWIASLTRERDVRRQLEKTVESVAVSLPDNSPDVVNQCAKILTNALAASCALDKERTL